MTRSGCPPSPMNHPLILPAPASLNGAGAVPIPATASSAGAAMGRPACALSSTGSCRGPILLVLPGSFWRGIVVVLPLIPLKGGEPVSKSGHKGQLNMFRCKQRRAPLPGIPAKAPSSFCGERRGNEMNELSPKAEAKNMKFAPTTKQGFFVPSRGQFRHKTTERKV